MLGVIVACLPFFPRFIDNVRKTPLFSRLAPWSGKSTDDPRSLSYSKFSSNNTPKPQGNLFTTDTYNWKTGTDNTNITGFPRSGSASSQGKLLRHNQPERDGAGNIYVLQDFQVLEERSCNA